jgi:hypothetical protein
MGTGGLTILIVVMSLFLFVIYVAMGIFFLGSLDYIFDLSGRRLFEDRIVVMAWPIIVAV